MRRHADFGGLMGKVGLVGFFGWGNFGDELFLQAWNDQIGRTYECGLVHDMLEQPYFSRPTREVAQEYDAFLIGGGDLITPNKISPLYWNSSWLTKPVCIASVGVPTWIKSRSSDVINRMSQFFRHENVRLIWARDAESADWIVENLHPRSCVRVHPDMVFSMDLPPRWHYARPTVGVAVRHRRGHRDDFSAVERACGQLVNAGYDIVKIVLATGEVGDRDEAVASSLSISGEILRSESLPELVSKIGGMSAIISMKFHGTVVATAYGVPAVALGGTSKSKNLLRRIDRSEMLSSLDDDRMYEKLTAGMMLPVPSIVTDYLKSSAREGMDAVRDRIIEVVEHV
ncbi:MAG: polysaccharide pyruvyl transferase family protein [Micrococcales bacterium]|nr:polysaccharide pyruvyl transferase family protein [Micrococcales bacterium]MCL2667639.1 polysaccharide pyruvyl transferase family protein [Micrococcales bacterium]